MAMEDGGSSILFVSQEIGTEKFKEKKNQIGKQLYRQYIQTLFPKYSCLAFLSFGFTETDNNFEKNLLVIVS
jgi:hypothetical protein